LNFESAQDKSRDAAGMQQPGLIRSFQTGASLRTCTTCGSPVQDRASRCSACGNQLVWETTSLISLQDTLLFFAVMLLIALVLAPVWPGDQIFGKAIFFLRSLGFFLPETLSEAEKYRSMVSNVIGVYHTLNIVYYLTIALVTFLLVFNRVRVSRGLPGFDKRVWLVLGLALLVFPFANLVISWNMFLTPGVIGTTIAALIVLFAGLIEQ